MPNFNKMVSRDGVGEQLMPPEVVQEVLQSAPEESIVLSRARQARMSTKKQKQPVLATLPDAYWVDGDTGLKETSDVTWKGLTITAEELAVIVPIPDAVVDDSEINLWEVVKPLIAEAIGKKVDQAVLFGVDKPDTFPQDLYSGATAAGNLVKVTAKKNVGDAVTELGEKMALQGYGVDAFASRPGLEWHLRGLKDTEGRPIYGAPMHAAQPSSLFGFPLDPVKNGAWDMTKAELMAIDWNKVIVGIRQDLTYEMFREGVISDNTGKVILNLMQQDAKAMRVVMRLGYQVANPPTRLASDSQFPAGVVAPAATTPGP